MIKIYANHVVFKELAKSICKCLTSLKYHAIFVNKINENDNELYIIFGGHELICYPPKNYIVYNLEQTNVNNKIFEGEYKLILQNAQEIWDYSIDNLCFLRNLLNRSIMYVPPRYSPVLEIHGKKIKKDIDVLFFGSKCERRENIQEELTKKTNLNVKFYWNSIWGKERDDLIRRSKVILNIHYYKNAILETPRITYLLANGCCVVSEYGRNKKENKFYKDRILFATNTNEIIQLCKSYCNNNELRKLYQFNSNKWFLKQTFNLPLETINKFTTKLQEPIKKRRKYPSLYIPCNVMEAETVHKNDSFTLKLPDIKNEDLPYVSIITPTFNRRKLFSVALYNWERINYPREKIEWVIVDDGLEEIKDMFPRDKRIKYFKIETNKPFPMGYKRNLCVKYASYDYIVNMDDDDHYFNESVLSRVKTLIKYNAKCVGCTSVGSYDLLLGNSKYITNGPRYFTESSLAFKKEFWVERQFYNDDKSAEYKKFLLFREKEMISIPFQFVTIAFTHTSNTTGSIRRIHNTVGDIDLLSVLDVDLQFFYKQLAKSLQK